MKNDDSFKKPGSVPFKWEIRPGVPKPDTRHSEFGLEKQHLRKQKQVQSPFVEAPRKLKPPPAGLYLGPPSEPQNLTRTRSFRASSARTFPHNFGFPGLAQPDVVSSAGCFPSPLRKEKSVRKRGGSQRSMPEPGYFSDLETLYRRSASSRKSTSTVSPSFASTQSSPQNLTRTRSFRASSARTFPHNFGFPGLAQPDVVSSAGCFPSPLRKEKSVRKRGGSQRSMPEPGYFSDLETLYRRSASSRKSTSTVSPSFASTQSSPRHVRELDWAAFALF